MLWLRKWTEPSTKAKRAPLGCFERNPTEAEKLSWACSWSFPDAIGWDPPQLLYPHETLVLTGQLIGMMVETPCCQPAALPAHPPYPGVPTAEVPGNRSSYWGSYSP